MQTEEYHKLAAVEDTMWYFRALHSHAATLIRAYRSPSNRRGRLLDAGCGTGGFARRASAWFPQLDVLGIDLFQIAVELASSRGTRGVSRASATAIPFPDGSMSVVTSLDVLQHIPDHETAARELFRVLEPGGLAVINAPAYMWLWSYHDDVTDTERRYTRPRMVSLLRGAGFDILRSSYWNFVPLPLVIAKRKVLARFGDGEADDVKQYPAFAERVLDGVMALERGWIGRISPLPAGSSVLVAARKPPAGTNGA